MRKGRLIPLHQDREVTRLGEGVFHDGRLNPQAMARTLKALRRFHRTVQSFAVERTRVVATSAMRDSNNGRTFAEWLKSATGREAGDHQRGKRPADPFGCGCQHAHPPGQTAPHRPGRRKLRVDPFRKRPHEGSDQPPIGRSAPDSGIHPA